MKRRLGIFLATAGLALTSALMVRAANSPEPIVIWPPGAPDEKGNLDEEKDLTKATDGLVAGKPVIRLGNVSQPTITIYRAPREKETGAAVVVCPGGGYLAVTTWPERAEQWLRGLGVLDRRN